MGHEVGLGGGAWGGIRGGHEVGLGGGAWGGIRGRGMGWD